MDIITDYNNHNTAMIYISLFITHFVHSIMHLTSNFQYYFYLLLSNTLNAYPTYHCFRYIGIC